MPKLALKLNTGPTPTPAAASPPVPTPGGSGLKLKLKTNSAGSPPASQPVSQAEPPKKEKRKYTKKADRENGATAPPKATKKRARDDEGETTPAKRQATRISLSSASSSTLNGNANVPLAAAAQAPLTVKTNSGQKIKLQVGKKPSADQKVKIKYIGQIPPRPIGQGYDSEAEDVEQDPAIESQFILRMPPGEDCDYLRHAIENKLIGLPLKDGGANVSMKFFDKEGRKAMVTIRGRHYAATIVDLPCVIEGMKSWDKKGWWKSADICQMLLVFAPTENEEQAQDADFLKDHLPKEVDKNTFQFSHGLTPPMHYVRKRRFRKRVNFRTIENIEAQVEKLLEEDDQCTQSGGTIQTELLDPEGRNRPSEDMEDVEDGYGPVDGHDQIDAADGYGEEDAEGEDDFDFEAALEEGMDVDQDQATNILETTETPIIATTPNGEHTEVIVPTANGHAEAEVETTGETPSASPAVPTSNDEQDSGDEEEEEEEDEEALAAAREEADRREQLAELQGEIDEANNTLATATNDIIRKRLQNKLANLENDMKLKKAALGIADDED